MWANWTTVRNVVGAKLRIGYIFSLVIIREWISPLLDKKGRCS